jgi:hypothetical protein
MNLEKSHIGGSSRRRRPRSGTLVRLGMVVLVGAAALPWDGLSWSGKPTGSSRIKAASAGWWDGNSRSTLRTLMSAGGASGCRVRLRDSGRYMTAPLNPAQIGHFEIHWLLKGRVNWGTYGSAGSALMKFPICPPKRVLVIGDSIAFTLGVPMIGHENRYGVELANASILGCGFGTTGEVQLKGGLRRPPAPCARALHTWYQDIGTFHAQAVIVELGFRDEFNWLRNGHLVHLGQAAYDRSLQRQIGRYIQVLGRGGTPILFLTVPYAHPGPFADGSPSPPGFRSRHDRINSLITAAAQQAGPSVRVLNIDRIISPGNHYAQKLRGSDCRGDGIHFTPFCAGVLQPYVLNGARGMIDASAP